MTSNNCILPQFKKNTNCAITHHSLLQHSSLLLCTAQQHVHPKAVLTVATLQGSEWLSTGHSRPTKPTERVLQHSDMNAKTHPRPSSTLCAVPFQTGCDMAYVFTSASAAPVIKGYSPELMVLPDLPEQPTLPMLGNLTAAVLGSTGQPTEQELQVCVGGRAWGAK